MAYRVSQRINAVADQREGLGEPDPAPFFFDQNEARRAEKNFFGDRPRPHPPTPPYLRLWMTAPPHHHPLSEGLDLTALQFKAYNAFGQSTVLEQECPSIDLARTRYKSLVITTD